MLNYLCIVKCASNISYLFSSQDVCIHEFTVITFRVVTCDIKQEILIDIQDCSESLI